jgi:hypothetical protein
MLVAAQLLSRRDPWALTRSALQRIIIVLIHVMDLHCRIPRPFDIHMCGATFCSVKDTARFRDQCIWPVLDFDRREGIFLDMETLRKRTSRTAWQDWKQDHWLAQAAFGLCLLALAVWLVVLYQGYQIAF